MRFRLLCCVSVILTLLGLLLLRLWQVQVLHGDELMRRSRRQSIRPVRLNPVRGRIFDRAGTVLVENEARYDLGFYLSEMRQRGRLGNTVEHVVEKERILANYLGRESRLDRGQVLSHLRRQPVLPLIVMRNLTVAELSQVAEYLPALPGVEIIPRSVRSYPHPGMLTHVLGMTGMRQPDGEDVREDLPRLYVTAELRGLSGLEAAFDATLSGQPGAQLLMVDSVGYARERVQADTPPVPGNDLFLAIDAQAQKAAEEQLREYSGAIVVLDVSSGAVLAMASSPGYDLAALTAEKYRSLMRDEAKRPLLNRATRGLYSPGSILKPLLALAALEEIPGEAKAEYDCTGAYYLNRRSRIRCAHRSGHGPIGLRRALAVSCNPFFINLGVRLGIDKYSEFLRSAGIGGKTGVEIGELAGVCPGRQLAQKLWKRNWIVADTAFASIGQGAVSVTPLQAAVFTAAIANGGIVYEPFLVQRVQSRSGEVLYEHAPVIRRRLQISPENAAEVREGMGETVWGEEASAARLRSAPITLGAKTGTAEVAVAGSAVKQKNTWVIAFGPLEEPKYAFACVIERGQSGSRTAVPVAAGFFEAWLGRAASASAP